MLDNFTVLKNILFTLFKLTVYETNSIDENVLCVAIFNFISSNEAD